MTDSLSRGSFTLPGEAGYEKLTEALAEKWGADTIRDSDGTKLSDSIMASGYDIYSTLCLVRADNAWAKANRDKLQQNFLMSFPLVAEGAKLTIALLDGFSRDQFVLDPGSTEYWQVFDRTTGEELPSSAWSFDEALGTVTISKAAAWHRYTVNFMVFRIWEEISMYNHITNDWGVKEHLMSVEPRHPETQAHLLSYLESWLRDHPATKVVRFTSLFYNFCWLWGDRPGRRFVYSDWGSYDFTVNPIALREFERAKGYRMTSEDFVNAGRYGSNHNPPSARYRDWIDFTNAFVVEFGRKCVKLVHDYGKKAFLFYDDHWVGTEPYGERFADFGFDGIIKCVFNAFEARLCAGVKGVKIHELRLHPYLFPTGLKGEPTFKEGGNPTLDAKRFWAQVRRGILRAPVDRIGLGGYLHLVEPFPDFQDYIAALGREFRLLKSFHEGGAPYALPVKVGILSAWGATRSWICSGHLHEHPEIELTNILEALAGLPLDICFLSLDEVAANGVPPDVHVLINAGREGSAWSGGAAWSQAPLVERLRSFVAGGGALIGVGEPTAVRHGCAYFQLSDVLGVDREIGLSICSNKYAYAPPSEGPSGRHFVTADLSGAPRLGNCTAGIYALDGSTQVLADEGGSPTIALREYGHGRAVYLAGFSYSFENARLLHRAIAWTARKEAEFRKWTSEDYRLECAYYPAKRKLVVINDCDEAVDSAFFDGEGKARRVSVEALGIAVIDI
jgi:1,3-beta-galactosyl-N-acetylhexosamine phosphorylase